MEQQCLLQVRWLKLAAHPDTGLTHWPPGQIQGAAPVGQSPQWKHTSLKQLPQQRHKLLSDLGTKRDTERPLQNHSGGGTTDRQPAYQRDHRSWILLRLLGQAAAAGALTAAASLPQRPRLALLRKARWPRTPTT